MAELTPSFLGNRLAQMRMQLQQQRGEHMTQRRLAKALGVKPQAYNSWEQGKNAAEARSFMAPSTVLQGEPRYAMRL